MALRVGLVHAVVFVPKQVLPPAPPLLAPPAAPAPPPPAPHVSTTTYAVFAGAVHETLVPVVAVTVCVSVTAVLLVPPLPDVRQAPFTTIQPVVMLIPLANVEVAVVDVTLSKLVCVPPAKVEVDVFDTTRLFTLVDAAERLPEKVEVEFVPATLRNPWMVEVPVVSPWMVVVAVPPT